ncbi:MAG: MGMT family protein [Fidelibacterota bacterium]
MNQNTNQLIYQIVCQIPSGKVATYGQIAMMVGCTARQVGRAMAATPIKSGIPWQRVINSQGKISTRSDGHPSSLQNSILVSEGITFDKYGKTDFHLFGWDGKLK